LDQYHRYRQPFTSTIKQFMAINLRQPHIQRQLSRALANFPQISFPSTAHEVHPAGCFPRYLEAHTNHRHPFKLSAKQKLAITSSRTNLEQMSSLMLLLPADLAVLGNNSPHGFPHRLSANLVDPDLA
jgi:hypothetical protein